ncbi:aspartate/glutamate racemase family protein [Variovorax sp. HJSM1_2]|uniref:aspartate/glutamate racemase family protein n=1 Tax=Variovorax sp. HJSM1_2 TaxID=3366263 RepID=UPI003BC3C152
MRHLLLLNPNTSASVTTLMQRHVALAAGPDVTVHPYTARFGAPYIACEASYAVASHASLDLWAMALAQSPVAFDAVLIGCFGDPGLLALRESGAVPVSSLAEASFITAAKHGRFAIVTGGQRWAPMLKRMAENSGLGHLLAGIHTVAPTGAQLAADPVAAKILLTQACADAAKTYGADAVILGGAGLAGVAATIQANVPVPVIDSVLAGTHLVLGPDVPPSERKAPAFDVTWGNVSPELTALGQQPGL